MVKMAATGQAEATEPAGAMEKAAVTLAVLLAPEAPAVEVEEEQAARVDSGLAAAAAAEEEGMVMAEEEEMAMVAAAETGHAVGSAQEVAMVVMAASSISRPSHLSRTRLPLLEAMVTPPA